MVVSELQDPSCEEMFAPYHPSAAEPNLTVSLWNQKHSVSIRDISQLTLAQFSSIWTVSLCHNLSLVRTCQLLLPQESVCNRAVSLFLLHFAAGCCATWLFGPQYQDMPVYGDA